MAQSASESTGIAGRYATALFDLARETGELDAVERDLVALKAALAESADLRAVVESPLYTRDDQGAALAAIGKAMGLSAMTNNVIGVMAAKRRLFALDALCAAFARKMSAMRGEVTAEVTSAQPLSEFQRRALADTLKGVVGREVTLNATVDESLIGGLVVMVGSKMIDTSIRSRLAGLQNAMKEVG